MSSPIRTHSLCEVVAGKRIGSSVAIGKIGGGFDGGNFGPLLIHFFTVRREANSISES